MKDGKYTQCAIISCNVSHKKEITSDTLNVQNEESSVIIVSDTLYYFTYVILYAINESIFIVNTTAPITGKITFQRLWFSDALIPAPAYIL